MARLLFRLKKMSLLLFLLSVSSPAYSGDRLDSISLPTGFSIAEYADLPGARSLSLGERTLFVGTRDEGKVYAVTDSGQGGGAGRTYVIARDLNTPNGVAFYQGDLYVAEIDRILRFADIESHLSNPPQPTIIRDNLPTARHHGWRYIAFGPDGRLYLSIGAPCNVCEKDDPRFATIARMQPDGSEFEIFARGVRNSVGFDWHPVTGDLWFTDNGRDLMGDDLPPDELNRADRAGLHFGFPYLHGKDVVDPRFGDDGHNRTFTLPVAELGAHVASLGMCIYQGTMFPASYRHQIFIAEHGSWNRSTPVGYRISLVMVAAGGTVAYEPFAEGWLGSGIRAWGRPVDLIEAKDGALLVSDDRAGKVYRIGYRGRE